MFYIKPNIVQSLTVNTLTQIYKYFKQMDNAKFNAAIDKFFNKIDNHVKKHFPPMVAETATEHYKQAFIDKAWNGTPWPSYKNKAREPRRGSLMMRSNNLFRSIRPSSITPQRVVISAGNSKVPYAKIHNEGGVINKTVTVKAFTRQNVKVRKNVYNTKTRKAKRVKVGIGTVEVKSHSRRMNLTLPQRQFMGKNPQLLNQIKNRFKTSFSV